MEDFAGRIAVVTGASSGLGRRFALDLARRGATVVALARRADLLARLSEEMGRSSPGSGHHACDVSNVDAYRDLLAAIEAEHGRIDVLVQAAGIEQPTPVEACDLEVYRRTFETNLFAPVAGTLQVLPGMLARRDGVVVNVSSDVARAPSPGSPAYVASKAALSAFTESVAHEVHGRGVHLHVLYPGWVPTPMGQGAVDAGMPVPPRAVRRSEEQVSAVLLARMGHPRIDIDAAPVARWAPVARALLPGVYARSVRRQGIPGAARN